MFFRAPKQQPFKAHLLRMTPQVKRAAWCGSAFAWLALEQPSVCRVRLCMGQRIAGVDGQRSHQIKFVSYPM